MGKSFAALIPNITRLLNVLRCERLITRLANTYIVNIKCVYTSIRCHTHLNCYLLTLIEIHTN